MRLKGGLGLKVLTSEAAKATEEGGKPMKPKHIVMYTRTGCEDSDAAREFLKKHRVAFEEVDIDMSQEALEFVMLSNQGKQRTPTFNVDGRTFHCSPFDPQKLSRDLGLPTASPVRLSKLKNSR